MSDPTADAATAHAPDDRRETSAGVVGVAFGLVVVTVLVLVVAIQGSKPLDPQALIETSFDVGELPFGLAPVEAAEIATGESLVVLAAGEIDEDPRLADDRESEEGEDDSFDWTTLEEGEAGTPPVQVFLVWYPKRIGGDAVERLFDDVSWKDLRDFEAGGGRLMTEKDSLAWAGYDAEYVIERQLERGGTFRDWMRVNLSLPDRACILFARWARGRPAAKERVAEILAELRPLEAEEG